MSPNVFIVKRGNGHVHTSRISTVTPNIHTTFVLTLGSQMTPHPHKCLFTDRWHQNLHKCTGTHRLREEDAHAPQPPRLPTPPPFPPAALLCLRTKLNFNWLQPDILIIRMSVWEREDERREKDSGKRKRGERQQSPFHWTSIKVKTNPANCQYFTFYVVSSLAANKISQR